MQLMQSICSIFFTEKTNSLSIQNYKMLNQYLNNLIAIFLSLSSQFFLFVKKTTLVNVKVFPLKLQMIKDVKNNCSDVKSIKFY